MTFSKFLCYADHIYLKFYQENCYFFNFLARAGEKPWWSDFEYGISATTEKNYIFMSFILGCLLENSFNRA